MLSIISTPIGNLEDITIRAIKTLFSVDLLLCEDTRRTGQLLAILRDTYGTMFSLHQEQPKLISYYDEVEFKKVPELIDLLEQGTHIGLVSDSGTPLINDPGFILIRECRKRNIFVQSIPGASAFLAALTSSGLPTDSFYYGGFLPEKEGQRLRRIEAIKQIQQTTIVCYCSPHKLETTLQNLAAVYGEDHTITLAKELTKLHETVWTGTIREALRLEILGEYVLLWRNS